MEHVETSQSPAAPLSAGAPHSTAASRSTGAQADALRGPAASRSSGAEHRARAKVLVAELHRMAAGTDDPAKRADLKRSADSLIRLATAYRP
ncbi:hypothetical protein GCM10029976_061760 [Kribbella albertanoniae]|uniref:Uncharacterized protein n=1 Tax=Kribbella albertanoniae TaxID=1266829 RepID=A0A4R4P1J9_9ACTN|nr:hypothetical protein [Kribbella albertanoniae]TDC13792.1 hypothetical protein E1261_44625 [Kribbella albertanoniae]